MRVLAIVKFNDGRAMVLNSKPSFQYQKKGELLIGTDDSGIFFDCLYYERPVAGPKAFGGREFDHPLIGGGEIHCNGQYWSGRARDAANVMGVELTRCTIGSIDDLRKCYVYSGCHADRSKFKELTRQYTGGVYGYWEYEKILKSTNRDGDDMP